MIGGGPGQKAFAIGIDRAGSREGERGLEHADLQCACGPAFLADFAGLVGVLRGFPLILVLTAVVLHPCHHLHAHGLHGARLDG